MSACNAHNFYAEVKDVCSYTEQGQVVFGSTPPLPSIHADCKAALEAILPYDSTWSMAPAGLKDYTTQAFQALIAYPLELPPDNKLFGMSPFSIPQSFLDFFHAEPNPNQAAFNHALNVIQTISYDPSFNNVAVAQWTPYNSVAFWNGQLSVSASFGGYTRTNGVYFTTPVLNAAILVHEAHHGDGYFHFECPTTHDFGCEADLNGPYGHEISYLISVLHGSGNARPNGQPPILSDTDVLVIGFQACSALKRIFDLPADLANFRDMANCGALDAGYFILAEGLTR